MKLTTFSFRFAVMLSTMLLSSLAFGGICEKGLNGRPALDQRGLVKALSLWLSPTQALLDTEDSALFSKNQIYASEWRALIEANSAAKLRLDENQQIAQAVVLTAAFQNAPSVTLPKDPRSLWSRIRGRSHVNPEKFEAAARQLWKIRPAGLDLTLLNPQLFAEIGNFNRYQDLFRAQLEALVTEFDNRLNRWPANWGQWTEQVRGYLDEEFPQATPANRRFLVQVLETALLDVPTREQEETLFAKLRAALPEKISATQTPAPRSEEPRYPTIRKIQPTAAPTAKATIPAPTAKREAVATYQIGKAAFRDLRKLQDNLRERFDDFLRIITFEPNPARVLNNGSWQFEKLRMQRSMYSVRLNQGYRVIFKWEGGNQYFIEHVDNSTTH